MSSAPADPPPWVCRAGGPGMGRKIALDVARGLTFLHSNRIAHMDLKTPNGALHSRVLLLAENLCHLRSPAVTYQWELL